MKTSSASHKYVCSVHTDSWACGLRSAASKQVYACMRACMFRVAVLFLECDFTCVFFVFCLFVCLFFLSDLKATVSAAKLHTDIS